MSNSILDLGLVIVGVLVIIFFLYWMLRCIADNCDTDMSLPLNNEDSRLDPSRCIYKKDIYSIYKLKTCKEE